jgi:ribonuclease HI
MRTCTVYAAASSCATTGAGGWGAWIRKGDRIVVHGGTFKDRVTDAAAAEMAAATNGIALASALGMAGRGDLVVVVSGCNEVVRHLADPGAARNPRFGRMVESASSLARRHGFGYKVNKALAHPPGSPRNGVSDLVDAEARRHMGAARELAASRSPRRQPPFDGVAIPARALDWDGFGGMPALFAASPSDGADTELLVSRPFAIDREIEGVLDLAIEMWSRAFMGREQFKRAVHAAARATRKHARDWERLCAATATHVGEAGWPSKPGGMDIVRPEEIVAAIMSHQRQGHEGIRRALLEAFPPGAPGHAAAWPEVAFAAGITGHDSFLFRDFEGNESYATLRPEAARHLGNRAAPEGPAPTA